MAGDAGRVWEASESEQDETEALIRVSTPRDSACVGEKVRCY